MSLIDKAISMKGQVIKVKCIRGEIIEEGSFIKGKAYSAVCDGVGFVDNALFTGLKDEFGNMWSGQLNGKVHDSDFRIQLYPNFVNGDL